MERTISFSDWVNEYKPVEFNEFLGITDTITIGREAVNIIGKYLSRDPFKLGNLPNHIATCYKIYIPSYCIQRVVQHVDLRFYMITRKPRMDIGDRIIVDFSKERPVGSYSKIVLAYQF